MDGNALYERMSWEGKVGWRRDGRLALYHTGTATRSRCTVPYLILIWNPSLGIP